MKKRISAALVALCLILTLPLAALAAKESRMIQWTKSEPGKLSMLLTS